MKPKVKSKQRCSLCGEIIAPGQMRFRWCPLADLGARICFDQDCAVRTHEVSRRTFRRSLGLTRDLQAELHKILDGASQSISTSRPVSEPPAEVDERGLEEAALAATPETESMPPSAAEIAETKLHLPLVKSPAQKPSAKKRKLEKDTKGAEAVESGTSNAVSGVGGGAQLQLRYLFVGLPATGVFYTTLSRITDHASRKENKTRRPRTKHRRLLRPAKTRHARRKKVF